MQLLQGYLLHARLICVLWLAHVASALRLQRRVEAHAPLRQHFIDDAALIARISASADHHGNASVAAQQRQPWVEEEEPWMNTPPPPEEGEAGAPVPVDEGGSSGGGSAVAPETSNSSWTDSLVPEAPWSKKRNLNSCMPYTGVTCRLAACDSSMGSSECSWGFCYCKGGSCAGVDGKCHNEENVLVASGLRLDVQRWANYSLSAQPPLLQVAKQGGGREMFNLRKFPGVTSQGAFGFLLTAASNTDYALTMGCPTQQSFAQARRGKSDWACSVEGKMEPVSTMTGDLSPQRLAVTLWSVPENPGTRVMIESNEFRGYFLYSPSGSHSLNGWEGDPGTGGYWMPDPPLPLNLGLFNFSGAPCVNDCGY